MKFRKRLSKKKSRKLFKNTASKTHKKNIVTNTPAKRGGIRL